MAATPATAGPIAVTTPGISPDIPVPALGISTSVFERAFTPDLVGALDEAGISVVEVVGPVAACSFDQLGVRLALRAALRAANVRLRSVHLPYGPALDLSQVDTSNRLAAIEATTAHLQAAAELGATLAIVHPSAEPIDGAERTARIGAARRSLEALAPVAVDLGVLLAVECLPRTCLANTAAELAALVGELDPAAVGVCIDVNHLNLREPDLKAAVGVLAPRLLSLHCSDNDGVDERHWLPGAPGAVVDWSGFFRGLAAAGYHGPFVYELRPLGLSAKATLDRIVENYRQFVAPRWRAMHAGASQGSSRTVNRHEGGSPQ
jgi:sugar phosphate isomerase/epimerase